MAGGNAQRTGYVDIEGPANRPAVYWGANLGILGDSLTQPIIDSTGNVYATSAPIAIGDGTEPLGALVSYNSEGEERWRYEWSWDPSQPGQGGSCSQLSVPALTPDGGIVMGFRGGWLRCWEQADGALRWERDLTLGSEPITSAPAVDRAGFVYVHPRDSGTVQKIDPKSGDAVWVHAFKDGIVGHASSPALTQDESTVFIGVSDEQRRYIYAMDAATGTFEWLWFTEAGDDHSFAWSIPSVSAQGIVHVQDETTGRLYAIDAVAQTATWADWKDSTTAPRLRAMDETCVFTSVMGPFAKAVAVNMDGSHKWSFVTPFGMEISGLLATRNALYFAVNMVGAVYALNKETGQVIWRLDFGPNVVFGEGMSIAEDGTLYVGMKGHPSHPGYGCLVALR